MHKKSVVHLPNGILCSSKKKVFLPVLFLMLRETLVVLGLLSMMLAVGLSYMAFITLGYVPSIPTLLRVFIMNGS